MRIGFVYPSVFPWDPRAAKIVKTLQIAGHQIALLSRGGPRHPAEDVWEGIPVERLSAPCTPFDPRWKRFIHRAAVQGQWDVLIARDIKAAANALFPPRVPCPVVLDMAENYPAAVAAWSKTHPVHWLTRHPRLVQLVEDLVLSRVDHVLVVVEENRDRLRRRGFPTDRISVLPNYPSLQMAPQGDLNFHLPSAFSATEPLRLVYVGGLDAFRYEILLTALAEAKRRKLPVCADIIGHDVGSRCQKMAAGLGLDGTHLRFHGYLPFDQAMQKLSQYHVGVLLNRVCEHTNTTVPNKLFEYLMVGLPVLSTPMAPVKRILESEQAGVVTASGSAEDVASALGALRSDFDLHEMSRRARRAFLERYHWEAVESHLLRAVEAAAGGRR